MDDTLQHASKFFGGISTTKPLRNNLWSSDDVAYANHITRHYNEYQKRQKQPRQQLSLKIPKIIHFIWLGPNSISNYPNLISSNSNNDNDTDDARRRNHLHQRGWNGTMKSWCEHHRQEDDWTVQLWNETKINELHQQTSAAATAKNRSAHEEIMIDHLSNLRKAYDNALKICNYGMASDIARLDILYHHGGVYVDVDYYCIDSVYDLHYSGVKFYCGASNTQCVEMNNGLMGCMDHHPLVKNMIVSISNWYCSTTQQRKLIDDASCYNRKGANLKDISFMSFLDESTLSSFREAATDSSSISSSSPKQQYQPMEVIRHTGPGLLTRTIFDYFQSLKNNDQHLKNCNQTHDDEYNMLILPTTVFHPFPNSERLKCCEKDDSVVVDQKQPYHYQTTTKPRYQYLKIVKDYSVPGTTKAVHLWGCSWQ